MQSKLNNRVDKMKQDIISSTQKIIKIKSVKSDERKGMPFGEGVNKTLETFLAMAETMGMNTKNVDGYAGHVEIGKGDKILGILCHLDVVPEGNDWTYPPYNAEIHDNKIYGRGTIDDKGPAVAALYAMKAVKDMDIKLNRRVRLILGTNEESGCKGLEYYLNKEESPDFSFSPDAAFPVIHAEKGILIFKLKYKLTDDGSYQIKSIKGGNAPNMVPDYCQAVFSSNNIEQLEENINNNIEKSKYNLKLNRKDDELILVSKGKSAHGSRPEKGQNAISQLMVLLNELTFLQNDMMNFINTYVNKIGMEYYGQSIGCSMSDDVSGKLIFNVGMIDVNNESAEITVNIRYPVKNTKDEVITGIKDNIKDSGLIIEEGEHMGPLFVPKDNEYVKKLMSVYRAITGDDSEPIAIGGGTYARRVEKGVAFGCVFPGQPEIAHQKDEYIDIDKLIESTKIYSSAINELAT